MFCRIGVPTVAATGSHFVLNRNRVGQGASYSVRVSQLAIPLERMMSAEP